MPRIRLIVFLCLAAMLSCSNDPLNVCASGIESRSVAPDGTHEAILYIHGCGALAGDTTNISLLPIGTAKIDQSGNVFVAVEGKPGVPTNQQGVMDITLHWSGDNQLLITYPACAAVGHKVERFDRYEISYLAVPCASQKPAAPAH